MNITYNINEKERIVVCIIRSTGGEAVDRIARASGYSMNFDNDKYRIPTSHVGIAKCAQEDTWDEETGKHLARERALNKYYGDIKTSINLMEEAAHNCFSNCKL